MARPKTSPRVTCAGETVRGTRCRAAPLKGTERCGAHPLEPGSARFGSREQAAAAGAMGGRPAVPRPTDVQRRLVEENALVVLKPYWRILGYDIELTDDGPRVVERVQGGAKLSATFEGDVVVSEHDDLGAMMNAAERMLDRVHGKPKQQTEISGPDGAPVQTEQVIDWSRLSIEDRRAMADLYRKAQGDAPAGV